MLEVFYQRGCNAMNLIYITANPEHARIAQAAGVDRIMVDMEIKGKEARQGHLNTVISHHTIEDVWAVRSVLPTGHLMVRINPIDEGSAVEIEDVLAAGADQVMLPMFTGPDQVEQFLDCLGGRAQPVLLLETPQALARLVPILDLPGDFELHVGLNDLHLGLGLDFMFEVLTGGLLEGVAQACEARGVLFGFGGIARIGGTGAISAEHILGEHVRLGSRQVILSRDFRVLFEEPCTAKEAFAAAVAQVRRTLSVKHALAGDELEANRQALRKLTGKVARSIAKSKRRGK